MEIPKIYKGHIFSSNANVSHKLINYFLSSDIFINLFN